MQFLNASLVFPVKIDRDSNSIRDTEHSDSGFQYHSPVAGAGLLGELAGSRPGAGHTQDEPGAPCTTEASCTARK